MKKLGFLFALIAVLALGTCAFAGVTGTVSFDHSAVLKKAAGTETTSYLGTVPSVLSFDMYLGERVEFGARSSVVGSSVVSIDVGALTATSLDSGLIISGPEFKNVYFLPLAVAGGSHRFTVFVVSDDTKKVASLDVSINAKNPIEKVEVKPVAYGPTSADVVFRSFDITSVDKYTAQSDFRVYEVTSFDVSGTGAALVSADYDWAADENIWISADLTKSQDIDATVNARKVIVSVTGNDNSDHAITEDVSFKVSVTFPATPVEPKPVPLKDAEKLIPDGAVYSTDVLKEKDGTVYFDHTKLPKTNGVFLLNGVTSLDSGKMVEVPGFQTVIATGTKALVSFDLNMSAISEKSCDASPREIVLFKQVLGGTYKELNWHSGLGDLKDQTDGHYTLVKDSAKGYPHYKLSVVIADGGVYDLTGVADGVIFDPMLFGVMVAKGNNPNSGGGCTAAYAPFALILAAPLFFLRKKD